MKIYQIYLGFVIFLLFIILTKLHSQTSGMSDVQFGACGKVEIIESDGWHIKPITLLMPDKKILVISTSQKEGRCAKIVLTRLLPNGNRDATFGANGQLSPKINFDLGTWGAVTSAIKGTKNRLLLCGVALPCIAPNNNDGAAFIIALNQNGAPDVTFGNGGSQLFDFKSYLDKFVSILSKPDGKVIASGYSSKTGEHRLLAVQLLPDGSLDPDFAVGGTSFLNPNPDENSTYIKSMVLQDDGKFIIFGSVSTDTGEHMQIRRFNSDGAADCSFALNGSLTFDFTKGDLSGVNIAYAGAIQPDQKIIFCGASYYHRLREPKNGILTLFRLNPDGSLDNSFGTDGKTSIDHGRYDEECTMVLQADNKILVGSVAIEISYIPNLYPNVYFTRFNTEGSLDQTFGHNGVLHPANDTTYWINNILVDEDGKVLCSYDKAGKIVLWRYQNVGGGVLEETKMEPLFQFDFTPNPVSSHGQLHWTMQSPGELSSDLLDTQGRLVKHLIPPTFYPAGAHQQDLYFENNIPAGVYSLVVTTGSERQVLKLVKL